MFRVHNNKTKLQKEVIVERHIFPQYWFINEKQWHGKAKMPKCYYYKLGRSVTYDSVLGLYSIYRYAQMYVANVFRYQSLKGR